MEIPLAPDKGSRCGWGVGIAPRGHHEPEEPWGGVATPTLDDPLAGRTELSQRGGKREVESAGA